ncbi:hypothetical protein LIER_18944 [Lithospermum erythrorhizon]|uniref:Integrase zinc-binding domain-containing protein n=1 Tax=Lithospermum erythrorhizon TaxID=34254 RepID=A0AAV3QI85_LITER
MDQIRGDCGIKNESLIKYHAKATTLAEYFTHIIFEHIPRTENEEANRLSKLATGYYNELPKEVYVEVRDTQAYEETSIKAVLEEPRDWRTDIARFLHEGLLSADSTEARKIQQISLGFCMHIGGRPLATKITRTCYFWPTLVRDSTDFVQKCEAC